MFSYRCRKKKMRYFLHCVDFNGRRKIKLASSVQFMASEKLFLSPEDEDKRASVIKKLNEILLAWVKKVAWQRRLPKQQIAAASATLLIYGSYCLGVHDSESDIDAVCVGPFFATMKEDFFIVLRNMLESRPEVSEIQCVKCQRSICPA